MAAGEGRSFFLGGVALVGCRVLVLGPTLMCMWVTLIGLGELGKKIRHKVGRGTCEVVLGGDSRRSGGDE